jgi:hypothetical protein
MVYWENAARVTTALRSLGPRCSVHRCSLATSCRSAPRRTTSSGQSPTTTARSAACWASRCGPPQPRQGARSWLHGLVGKGSSPTPAYLLPPTYLPRRLPHPPHPTLPSPRPQQPVPLPSLHPLAHPPSLPRPTPAAQMSFTRRRQDASCLNGGDYKRPPPANTTCTCTATDVECDWGWARDCMKCTQLPEVRRREGRQADGQGPGSRASHAFDKARGSPRQAACAALMTGAVLAARCPPRCAPAASPPIHRASPTPPTPHRRRSCPRAPTLTTAPTASAAAASASSTATCALASTRSSATPMARARRAAAAAARPRGTAAAGAGTASSPSSWLQRPSPAWARRGTTSSRRPRSARPRARPAAPRPRSAAGSSRSRRTRPTRRSQSWARASAACASAAAAAAARRTNRWMKRWGRVWVGRCRSRRAGGCFSRRRPAPRRGGG